MGLLLIIAVILTLFFVLHNKKIRKESIRALLKEYDLTPSEEIKDDESKMYVCIDRKAEKILFANVSAEETRKELVTNFNVSSMEQSYFKFLIFDDKNNKVIAASNRLKDESGMEPPFVKVVENIQVTKYEFLKESTDTCFYIFDEVNKSMTIGNISCGKVEQLLIDNILKVEIVEDNVTTIDKSVGNTIGKSLVGGAIAGSTGAIIGGASANSSVNTMPEKIAIKFYIKDVNSPSYILKILDSSSYSSKAAKKDFANAAKPFAMNICDTINSYKAIHDNKLSSGNISLNIEALTKLAELKEKGFLTNEEFAKEKGKILN